MCATLHAYWQINWIALRSCKSSASAHQHTRNKKKAHGRNYGHQISYDSASIFAWQALALTTSMSQETSTAYTPFLDTEAPQAIIFHGRPSITAASGILALISNTTWHITTSHVQRTSGLIWSQQEEWELARMQEIRYEESCCGEGDIVLFPKTASHPIVIPALPNAKNIYRALRDIIMETLWISCPCLLFVLNVNSGIMQQLQF